MAAAGPDAEACLCRGRYSLLEHILAGSNDVMRREDGFSGSMGRY